MASTDPVTGQKLPVDAIQRVLFVAPKAFVYAIPPITSAKGFNAASWTANPKSQIFTARIRILETATPTSSAQNAQRLLVHVLLEDPSTGQLFAACPYTSPASIERALDSTRFYAVRVVGDGGMKATLGIGFEERSDSFDFNVSLQDARRTLGLDGPPPGGKTQANKVEEPKLDFSLKEGQTITVNIGSKGRRGAPPPYTPYAGQSDAAALFSIKPPPSAGGGRGGGGGGGGGEQKAAFVLAPPPSAADVRAQQAKQAQDAGFDDGEFGEFQ